MANDFSNEILETCRTCLNKDEKLLPLISTIDQENATIIDYFKKYMYLEYLEYDIQMPTNICLKCFDRLLEVRKFSIQCRESENYLYVKMSLSSMPQKKKFIDNDEDNVEIKYEVLVDERNDYNIADEAYTNIEVLDDDGDFIESEKTDQDSNLIYENEVTLKTEDEKKYEESEIIDNSLDFNTASDSDSQMLENIQNNINSLQSITSEKEDYEVNYKSENLHYQCEDCGSAFSYLKNYIRHKATHINSNNDDKTIIPKKLQRGLPNNSCLCPKCGREFPTKKKMQTHLYKHNQSEFICNKCGKVYHHYGSFKEHDFIHQGIKPYKCEYCDKEFRQKTAQIIHMKLHTGKDIECKLCDKKFAVQSQLRIHMTYHTNDLKFPCDICPKRYRKNNLLQMHRATHSDIKTVKCEYCDSYFYTKDALRTHKNSVHIRKYFCNLCPRRLPNPADLKKHFLNNHGVSIEDISPYKKKLNEITLLMTKSTNNEEESEPENL